MREPWSHYIRMRIFPQWPLEVLQSNVFTTFLRQHIHLQPIVLVRPNVTLCMIIYNRKFPKIKMDRYFYFYISFFDLKVEIINCLV